MYVHVASKVYIVHMYIVSFDDRMSLSVKRLEWEEFWYKELCTVYPYA